MYYSPFLHIYQPPEQKKSILSRITNESYHPLIEILRNNPRAKLTLNINACLTEQFIQNGDAGLVLQMRALLEEGRLELTESAKYHALLALLPEAEIRRQIELNRETHKKIFGGAYQPKGFFIPEMAYSRKVADIVADMGYEWIIINETSLAGKQASGIKADQIYHLEGKPNLKIFFRNRHMSDLIHRQGIKSAEKFIEEAKNEAKDEGYFITAMDGEIFGHHRPGYEKLLKKLYASNDLRFVVISELTDLFKPNREIEPLESSWSSLEHEISEKIPFSLWDYPGNPVHEKQWKLTNLAIETIEGNRNDDNYPGARARLDAALFSCQYWWASSIPWWKVEMVEKGARMLKRAVGSLNRAPDKIKRRIELLYEETVIAAYRWENSGQARQNAEIYGKKIAEELGPYVP